MEDVQLLRVTNLVHTIRGALATTDYYSDDSAYRNGETQII